VPAVRDYSRYSRTNPPEPTTVVGDPYTVEVVPTPGRPATEPLRPDVVAPLNDDDAAADGVLSVRLSVGWTTSWRVLSVRTFGWTHSVSAAVVVAPRPTAASEAPNPLRTVRRVVVSRFRSTGSLSPGEPSGVFVTIFVSVR
jgi:hypothetical protein